jgi:hypothetical protein
MFFNELPDVGFKTVPHGAKRQPQSGCGLSLAVTGIDLNISHAYRILRVLRILPPYSNKIIPHFTVTKRRAALFYPPCLRSFFNELQHDICFPLTACPKPGLAYRRAEEQNNND